MAALVWLAVVPAIAQAETRSFINTDVLFPTGNANGTFGPATKYPSSIVVSGLTGTVTKATVTVFGIDSGNADDIDMVITGPNGQQVMLMSDACGASLENSTFTFDDSAPTFLSDPGPCARGTFKPSNYSGSPDPEPDDLSPTGGPAPPYLNALSFLAGSSPNGAWNLFVLDDNAEVIGFVISGWALTLEIEPPPDPGGGGGGGGGAGDTTAPDTQITAGPKAKSKKRKASFSFTSTEPGSTFECRLDDAAFAACAPPLEMKVEEGKHKFEVRATDSSGNVDPTPATQTWKVKKTKKKD